MGSARALLVVLACLGVMARAAHAQPPAGDPPRRASADTTAFFPRWMHPWFELGGDWLSGPSYMDHAYKSGEAVGAGFAVRAGRRLELRAAIDYQSIEIEQSGSVIVQIPEWGVADTIHYNYSGNAWTATLRPEVGLSPGLGLWLTGGLGGGYMNSGYNVDPSARVPEPFRNGWGWLWTAAARWDIEPDPMIPLGLEARTTGLKRGPDFVRTWSIRIAYRVPDFGRGRPPR